MVTFREYINRTVNVSSLIWLTNNSPYFSTCSTISFTSISITIEINLMIYFILTSTNTIIGN